MRKRIGKHLGRLVMILLFTVMFVIVFGGLGGVSQRSAQEGIDITRQSIERAAIVNYASEGYYPPSLAYIEQHFNLQINRDKYFVSYEVFASNIMPVITVLGYDPEGGFR